MQAMMLDHTGIIRIADVANEHIINGDLRKLLSTFTALDFT